MTDDAVGIGGSFNPNLTTTPDAAGNFVGNPAFANVRDPRPAPMGQGPNLFVLDANFDLTTNSAAIDNAINSWPRTATSGTEREWTSPTAASRAAAAAWPTSVPSSSTAAVVFRPSAARAPC